MVAGFEARIDGEEPHHHSTAACTDIAGLVHTRGATIGAVAHTIDLRRLAEGATQQAQKNSKNVEFSL